MKRSRSQSSRGLTKNASGVTPYTRLRQIQRDLCAMCNRLLRFDRRNLNNSAIANHSPPFRTTSNANRPPDQLICKTCDVLKQRSNAIKYPQRRTSKASTSRITNTRTLKVAKEKRTKKGKLFVNTNNKSERANYFRALRLFQHECTRCGKKLQNVNAKLCGRCGF